MSDLISRQAAIDAIRKEYAGIHDANTDGDFLADEIEFIIKKVPSVQPESSDCISRQAAFEKLTHTKPQVGGDGTKERFRYLQWIADNEAIRELPSVQERKKGRWVHDGRNFPGGIDWVHCSECGQRCTNVPADLSNYCPNCGAEMEGAKDE